MALTTYPNLYPPATCIAYLYLDHTKPSIFVVLRKIGLIRRLIQNSKRVDSHLNQNLQLVKLFYNYVFLINNYGPHLTNKIRVLYFSQVGRTAQMHLNSRTF